MVRLCLSLLLLPLSAAKTFQPRPMHALHVRGGAGPIDPEVAGKILTGAYLAQGTSSMLAPSASAEAYGRETSPLSEVCTASFGAFVASIGVVGYSLLVNKSSVNGAIGAGLVTIVLGDNVRAILNDFPGRHGMNKIGLILNTLFVAFTAFALLSDQDYASKLSKALCVYGGANGLFGCINAGKFATAWGIDENEIDTGYILVLRLYCWTLIAFCAMSWALLADVEPVESIAYASILALAGLVSQNFVTKDVEKLGMKPGPQYAWMVTLVALIASILLPAKESSPA